MLDHEKAGYLDGLRGFAALIVLFGHCSNAGLHLVPGFDVSATAKGGVWLFFVLSAYLLTSNLITAFETERPRDALLSYAARRVLRILPLYYVVLLWLTLCGWMTWGTLGRHLLLIEAQDHFWTIPVEMSFYAILPLLCIGFVWLPQRWRLYGASVMLAMSLIVYVLADPSALGRNSMNVANYAPFFAMGILIALLPRNTISGAPALWMGIAGLALSPLFSPRVFGSITEQTIVEALAWSWPWAFTWGAVLLSLANGSHLRLLFSASVLRFVGKISFGVYLIHFHIILWLRDATFVAPALKPLAAVLLTGGLATAAFYLVERPSLRWAYRLTRLKSRPRPKAIVW